MSRAGLSKPRVLLLGATGQIGIFAIPRLVNAGFEVIAISRGPKPDWYPRFGPVHWMRLDDLDSDVTGDSDMLVSAGPIEVASREIPPPM